MLKIFPASFGIGNVNIEGIIAGLALVAAVIGGAIGIVSTTSFGDELSSAIGIIHESKQKANDDTPRTDLQNETRVQWFAYQKVDDNKVRVFFNGGTPKCHGYRAEVVENPTTVEIKVFEGNPPNAPEVCTMEARKVSLVVELKQPLGARILKN